MPTVPPIKKNDEVYILRGKDRGKTGRVLIVIPERQKDRGRRRSDDQAAYAAESAAEHQGRHRREGSADSHFQCGDRLQELQEAHPHREPEFWPTAAASRACKKCGNTIE